MDRGMLSNYVNEDRIVDVRRRGYAYEALKQYIKACINLFNKQQSVNMNTMDIRSPRGPTLKEFERSLKRLCAEDRADDFIDRGIGSIQDGHIKEDLIAICHYYFGRPKMQTEALRDRMIFLMNHMMLLRGETSREIDLSHMFSLEFTDEGVPRCPVFAFMILNGKTNQDNQKLYSGVIRHKNVNTCALGAVGFYLFHRFHMTNERFPDFSENRNWFSIKLCPGRSSDTTKAVCYNTQLNSVNRAFDALGIYSSKKTHSCRGSGAREAEMAGASLDYIRRVGRWNSETMENSYLTCLPRQAMRIIHDFPEEHEIFKPATFLSFSEESLFAISNTTPPAEVEMDRVVPHINGRFNELSDQAQSALRTFENGQQQAAVTPAMIASLVSSIDNLQVKVDLWSNN